jgi:hypothetical protein
MSHKSGLVTYRQLTARLSAEWLTPQEEEDPAGAECAIFIFPANPSTETDPFSTNTCDTSPLPTAFTVPESRRGVPRSGQRGAEWRLALGQVAVCRCLS